MEKSLLKLDSSTTCTSWNYSAQRLAAGASDGTLSIFDSRGPESSSFSCTSKTKVHDSGIVKVNWVLPEFGDAVACIFEDGSFSLWEEVAEDSLSLRWKLCISFKSGLTKALDLQFGGSSTSLKMEATGFDYYSSPKVAESCPLSIYSLLLSELCTYWQRNDLCLYRDQVAAYSDGHVKVYELSNPLELNSWQLQAEFQNVSDSVSAFGKAQCSSASVSWNPLRGQGLESSFVLGYCSDAPQLNSSKVWEFDQAHQRWLPVAELALPEDRGDQVYAVAWAPNIGRPYEIIAVATEKGIGIWHIGTNPDMDGRLPVEKVTLLSGHEGQVWQMEWDMSGMTLATTGSDGAVKLWQSNLNGVWQGQATFQST